MWGFYDASPAARLTRSRYPSAVVSRKRIVLATFGSRGDLHPLISVGLEDSSYAQRAEAIAERVRAEDGVRGACHALETLL
jgi:hypothetical protein